MHAGSLNAESRARVTELVGLAWTGDARPYLDDLAPFAPADRDLDAG
jgi:hypothetical protein